MSKKPFTANLDLSALDEPTVTESSGKPMDLLLSDIEEDPNQPRKIFTEEAMAEIVDSIKEHGVIVPITVRPNPDKAGKWIINTGARRYKGSKIAGKETIPAVLTDNNSKVKQYAENEHRDNLKPLEIAELIKEMLEGGDKPADISRKLRKDKATITHYQALLDAPECILKICRDERTKSPKTLYALCGLYNRFPVEVKEWCEGDEEITRSSVEALEHRLVKPPVSEVVHLDNAPTSKTEISSTDNDGEQLKDTETPVTELPFHNREIEKEPKEPSIPDPTKIKKPLLLIEYKGRAAMVMLNKRPSNPGLLWIKYEDGAGEAEVDAGKCKINLLTESTA